MSGFCEDDTFRRRYFRGSLTAQQDGNKTDLALKVFEWPHDPNSPPEELSLQPDVLIERYRTDSCALRIVSVPSDSIFLPQLANLRPLVDHYNFPSAMLSEFLASVTFSFGSVDRQAKDGVSLAWCHFLCKDVQVRFEGAEETNLDDNRRLASPSWNWKVSHFVVHTRETPGRKKCVTLLCFGPPRAIIERFRRLLHHPDWRDAHEEPYLLFSIVYEELYNLLDRLAWKLADIFRPVETTTLDHARARDALAPVAVDFTTMHNISKHGIYMLEGVDAALLTLDEILAHLTRTRHPSLPIVTALTYRRATFKSTQLRLRSMHHRMTNTISLAFNLVTQHDSRVMANDSSAMKGIAVMTLVFLPATGIASVLSTPFFEVDDKRRRLDVATSFWIFWAVTLPLTGVLFAAWLFFYRESKRRRAGAVERRWRWFGLGQGSERGGSGVKEETYDSSFHRAPLRGS